MNPRSLSLALLLAFGVSAGADDVRRVALDGKTSIPAPAQEDGKDGIARIKHIDHAGLELFPAATKPSKGTIIVCPGGGYGILAVTHEGRDIAKLLNDAGWDAAVLLYHVSEGEQTRAHALEDSTAAVKLVRTQGDKLGLNSKRVGIMGFSAGGHLAARTAHEVAPTGGVDFGILVYPAYLEKDGKVLDDVAPPKVPFFVYVAGDDRYAPSSTAFAESCQAAGIRCDYTKAEKGGHGFGLKNPLPEGVREWPDKLRTFLSSLETK